MQVIASLPLRWDTALPNASALEQFAETNRRLLDAAQLLEERASEELAAQPELQRVHAKLDMLTLLLGELLHGSSSQPLVTVMLDPTGLELSGADGPATGERFLVQLWLHALLPMPWRWPVNLQQQPSGLRAEFDPLPESLAQAWERDLFRRHRREISARRLRG